METRNMLSVNYHAENPYPKKEITGWFSLLKYFGSLNPSSSDSVVEGIGNVVLPAQTLRAREQLSTEQEDEIRLNNLEISDGIINTHDGASLGTLQLTPNKLLNVHITDQNFIIKFNGNYMLYQYNLDSYIYDANKLQCNLIVFNYRGVGNSKKPPESILSFQDLVTDGIAQVNRLRSNGVPANHIVLDGLSLGGAIATMVASYFHDHGFPVYLWNDRSFAKLSGAAAGMVFPGESFLIESSVRFTLQSAKWEADVAEAYQKIPAAYKGYMFVVQDGVIASNASLHKAVKHQEKIAGQKTGHKFYANSEVGHNVPRSQLFFNGVNKIANKVTGQDVFENFVLSHRK